MSTLDDLRDTLDRHAEGLDDTGRQHRSAAVRRRVRVARRRRTAATAVTAALAVVGGIGAVATFQPPPAPEPAANTVLGVTVPGEVSILGFPYELSGDASLDGGDDRLRLGGSGEPRAVTLVASGLGSGSATLFVDDTAVARVFGDDPVALPVPVMPSDEHRPAVRVELHDAPPAARTGVAIYDATGEPATGVTNGDLVFRSTVAGDELVSAGFAPAGEARLALDVEGRLAETRIVTHCRTDEKDLWVHVAVLPDTEGRISRSCGSGGTGLEAGNGSSTIGDPSDDDSHTLEAVVTRGQDGPVVDDADVELGVAAYRAGEAVRIGGTTVATQVEHAGWTWKLDRDLSTAGERALTLRADTDLLLGFVAQGRGVHARWEGALTSGSTSSMTIDAAGPGVSVDGLLLRGDTYDVSLEADRPLVSGALLVYRPL